MNSENKKLYVLMSLLRGNWRNAFYVECKNCPFGQNCGGFLLTTEPEGSPILYSVSEFEKQTGETVDKTECVAVIDRTAFESLFDRWIVWNVSDKNSCSVRQIKQ